MNPDSPENRIRRGCTSGKYLNARCVYYYHCASTGPSEILVKSCWWAGGRADAIKCACGGE